MILHTAEKNILEIEGFDPTASVNLRMTQRFEPLFTAG